MCQRLQRRGFNGDGRTTVRPYSRYSSRFDGDGRTIERSYSRYSSRFNGDGRTTVRPYISLHVSSLNMRATFSS
ncbi:hypothetical protein [Porphyromonas uenonis]|uniref:hypothetical protein n=1 Tax=Porphyromonas uenonis TaxID=281920 RepID=UPI0012FE5B09|nr:hypothetical protein [Porphyromonas uenonis]